MDPGNTVPVPTDFDAANAPNAPDIEKQFAVAVVEHMITYEKLLSSIHPNRIKLTQLDDILLAHLGTAFPHLLSKDDNYRNLRILNEDEMKSPKGKEAWRNFVLAYEKLVPDYNFGTMIRTDCDKEYGQDNTTLVLRTQFLALEIARNRLGLNDHFHESQKSISN